MTTINIEGREFTVEKIDSKYTGYILRGKRGAVYGATRNIPSGRLFLVNLNGVPRVDPLGPGIYLTDADGSLRVEGSR